MMAGALPLNIFEQSENKTEKKEYFNKKIFLGERYEKKRKWKVG
jgi:hypothetical protein